MNQPRILQTPIWQQQKEKYFKVISTALSLLRDQPGLPEVEDSTKENSNSLNRVLAQKCFPKACYQHQLNSRPSYNSENPPYKDDTTRRPRESKKPDFMWQFIDDTANENNCERSFTIECKRLGRQVRQWKLNENYVSEGIRRFVTSPHEYGKGEDVCSMIGYVQNMTFDEILHQVNDAISNNQEPLTLIPSPTGGWQEKEVNVLKHELIRSFPFSPFYMCHFWIDLRDL